MKSARVALGSIASLLIVLVVLPLFVVPYLRSSPVRRLEDSIHYGRYDEAAALLNQHPEAAHPSGNEPLLWGADGDTRFIALILDHGADPNGKGRGFFEGWTPLLRAADGGTPTGCNVAYLLSRGARMDVHSAAASGNAGALKDLLD